MSTSSINPLREVFEEAQRTFRQNLKDPRLYDDILTAATPADVYKATAKIQEEAAAKGRLRNLGKIRSFLDRLSAFSAVIEVFISAKPDILALIWGPIKLLLLWSSKMTAALDKVTQAMEKIGRFLPQFALLLQTFEVTEAIKTSLVLFFEDMLDFYCATLRFFRKTRWQDVFSVIWGGHQERIDTIISNLNEHASLFKDEVTFVEIIEAREARIRSLAFFETSLTFQERQKFHGLKSYISPNLHDRTLDLLRGRFFAECAKWLLRNEEFCSWSQRKDGSRWFWLQGIPGAGKTYLAAAVIEHLKTQDITLFAFVSHADKTSLTALSVIHTLVFQAADDDPDFKAALLEANERELKSIRSYAAEYLRNFLTTAEATYIIVDGLDEMETEERQNLLGDLEKLSQAATGLKIIICSRAEDDISKALETKATTVQVHTNNLGSIQTYVDRRSEEWIEACQLDDTTRLELQGPLAMVAVNAKGMFLYARIIMDYLRQINTIDEVKRELHALPEDLNDAYCRIFERINNYGNEDRTRCRRVLGWIGCAPVALSALEMEQALSIDPKSLQIFRSIPVIYKEMNFVQMCGPIVEIVDEQLRFVHFTVQQSVYIFSKNISNSINKEATIEDLFATFLTYLSLVVSDTELEEEETQEQVLLGKYRLLPYAAFFWPAIVRLVPQSQSSVKNVQELLERLLQAGKNFDYKKSNEDSQVLYKNKRLQRDAPDAFQLVCATFQFHTNEHRWDWKWNDSCTWVDLDPVCISRLLVKLQEQHELLVRDQERRPLLCRHYGCRLFRCTYQFCPHSRRGFETLGGRKEHEQDHGQPWKCSIRECDWATIGFASKGRRDEHWLKVHLPTPSQLEASGSNFEKLDLSEVRPFLLAFTLIGDIENIKLLLDSPNGKRMTAENITAARDKAAELGSFEITKLLSPKNETLVPIKIVRAALRGKDIEFVRWAIERTCDSDYPKLIKNMLSARDDSFVSLWKKRIHHMIQTDRSYRGRDATKLIKSLFRQSLFSEIQNNSLKEARMKRILANLKGLHIQPEPLGEILVRIAKSSCSVPLTAEVLELGAPIDYPEGYHATGPSALRVAAKGTKKEAAFLMQFLISRGAETSYNDGEHSSMSMGTEPGALEIAKWVGKTWEELVVEQFQREASNSQSHIEPSRQQRPSMW